jgi:hypothetical protein
MMKISSMAKTDRFLWTSLSTSSVPAFRRKAALS